jgi:uncharacterized protein YraI
MKHLRPKALFRAVIVGTALTVGLLHSGAGLSAAKSVSASDPVAKDMVQAVPRATDMVTSHLQGLPAAQTADAIWVTLNSSTQAANLRSGPNILFSSLAIIQPTDMIMAIGRTEDNWLRVHVNGRTGWLAGDLVEQQAAIQLLSNSQVTNVPEVIAAPIQHCYAQPIRGFGKVWTNHPEIRPLLGCPYTNWRRNEHATNAAVQTFEHGWMLWLETDTVANVDPIYVFFETDGSYIRFGDRALVDAHSYALTPQDGNYHKVGDRFAKVFWEELNDQQRAQLGWAINEARDSAGAFQEFENGRMFWAEESDTIYTIYQGFLGAATDGQPAWIQQWASFEDTFEETETN